MYQRALPVRGWPYAAATTALLSLFAAGAVSAQQDTSAAIRYKAITLTPIMAAVGDVMWRSRNLSSDIGSPYQNIPFDNTTNAQTTEFRATGRHSRLGLLAETKSEDDSLSAFWESDFLAAGTTSKSDENDGYAVRLRSFWGMLTTPDKLSFVAGQMWTMLTTNRKGMMPRSEMVPLTIDAQYAVGYNWARQAAFRVIKTGRVVSAGASLEGAQTTFSARNPLGNVVVGQPGGSQLNQLQNYSTDLAPDLVGKIAFDPAGRGHYEIKAVARLLRDRVVDPAGVTGGDRSLSSFGGGVGFAAIYPFVADNRTVLDLGLSGLGGKGIARYGTSQFADATLASDGSLQGIKSGHLLFMAEAHPTRKLDVYSYEGVEYNDRTAFRDAGGRGVGYGSPLNVNTGCEVEVPPTGPYGPASGPCNADNRSMWQANLGFWYRLRRSAAGTIQWGMQYSRTVRETWSGVGGEPRGTEHMLFTSFRYLLP